MMYRLYIIAGVLAVSLFAYAQHRGWSIYASDEARPQQFSGRSAYHK